MVSPHCSPFRQRSRFCQKPGSVTVFCMSLPPLIGDFHPMGDLPFTHLPHHCIIPVPLPSSASDCFSKHLLALLSHGSEDIGATHKTGAKSVSLSAAMGPVPIFLDVARHTRRVFCSTWPMNRIICFCLTELGWSRLSWAHAWPPR